MKRLLCLLIAGLSFINIAYAQCPDGAAVNSITLPTCGNSDGKFTVEVIPAQTPALYESSVDGGVTWFQHTSGNARYNLTGKPAGLYNVQVRAVGTTALCINRQFVLRADYKSNFTATPSSATACNTANGSIVLGNVTATDQVSWISAYSPSFVTVSSLSVANTISNLKPGIYYVIIRNPANAYCYSTKTVTVGNTGTACPPATLCGNAQGPNNFPNGTFGNGTSLNGPALPAAETTYGYSQLSSNGPDDGFYAIANSTDFNGATAGGSVFGTWAITSDHTGDGNGYMMIVNASYDQDIVTEKTLTDLCPNKTYQFSAYIKNLKPNTGTTSYTEPNLTFLIDGVGVYNSGNISSSDWVNAGFTFQSTSSTAKVSIRNNNPGGNGNDWVIDDIFVGTCVPTVSLKPIVASCENPPTQAFASITDISRLYNVYKWLVDKNDGNGFVDVGGTVTASFDANNQYLAYVTLPSPITISNNGWKYKVIVGTSASDLTSATCSYTSVQTLIIQQCGILLPVKLNSIRAKLVNNKGVVQWQASQQVNLDHFELEKSLDGTNFRYIGTVAANNSVSTADYMATDDQLNPGINYYRIRVVDNNGHYVYSNIVTLVLKGNTGEVKIFPNPASDRLFIWMPLADNLRSLQVMDATGRTVIDKTVVSNATNVTDLETGPLPKGVYSIRLITRQGEVINERFIRK